MLLVDEDLELLEAFLDGALGADEMAALRTRLSIETELAVALEGLRADRTLRQSLFASLEPANENVNAFVTRINYATTRRNRLIRPLRIASALAACVLVSFFAGWKLRGHQTNGIAAGPTHFASGAPTGPSVQNPISYQVALTDETGQVTAVQNFNSLEKAREFTHDLNQWQERQRQMRDGAAIVVADRF